MRNPLWIISLALAVAPSAALYAQNTPSLQEQLEAQYPTTNMISIGGCKPGSAETGLVVNKEGIAAVPELSFAPKCASTYKGKGKMQPPGMMCTGKAPRIPGPWGEKFKIPQREIITISKGETVYPLKFEVKPGEVRVALGYCAPTASGSSAFFKGEVVFPFPADMLTGAHVTEVEDRIAEVFSPPSPAQQPPSPPDPPATPSLASPPPNAPSSPPSLVGNSLEQVIAALGQPQAMFDVGDKHIYVYKDLKIKITVVGGKVTAVE